MNDFSFEPVPAPVRTDLCTRILEAFMARTEQELVVKLDPKDERYKKIASLITILNRKGKKLGLPVRAVQRANQVILIKVQEQ